ncbi:MAG: glucodextranase DOMON-like domain-containing protein [Candidatus Wallbacteria bacterium]|nr:glucodextranase DOMON-like domain-containing protein [Candidatus Wallbacteria bacterium]
MRKLLLLLCATMLIAGCQQPKMPPLVGRSEKKTCFEWQDKTFDDHGPGTYTYPRDENLYERGTFDLIRFQVIDAGMEIYFRMEFRGRLNKQGLPTEASGWNHQLIDIYIDTNRLERLGYKEALPGRNVTFKPDSAWEKVILVSPLEGWEMKSYIEEKTEHLELKDMLIKKELIVPDFYFVSESVIVAKVLKKDLGEPLPNWGYQVLVMGFDKNNTDPNAFMNMEVKAVRGTNNFGGGSNFSGDTNVIDLLENSEGQQEKELRVFTSNGFKSDDKLAVIPMMYHQTAQSEVLLPTAVEQKIPSAQKETVVIPPIRTKQLSEICRNNMRELLDSAKKYWAENPDDPNVTVYDLLLGGYIKDIPKCPAGGRYDVFGEDTKKLKVKCYNPGGESHGIYEEEK